MAATDAAGTSVAAAAATDADDVIGFSARVGVVVLTREGWALASRTVVGTDGDRLECETRSRERRLIPEGAAKSANKGINIRGLILHTEQVMID